jgi:hypothetical protein
VKVPFADPWRTYTHAFERYVLDLSRFGTMQDVADHLDVSWDIVKDIQKRHLVKKYSEAQEPQGDSHRRVGHRQRTSLLHPGSQPP